MLLMRKAFAHRILASCVSMLSLCSFAEASDAKLGLSDVPVDHNQARKVYYYEEGIQALHAQKFDLAFENFINGAWCGDEKCATEVGKLLTSDKQFNWNPSVTPRDQNVIAIFDGKNQPKCTQPQIRKAFELLKTREVDSALLSEIQECIKNLPAAEWPEINFLNFRIANTVNQGHWWETKHGNIQYKQVLDNFLKINMKGNISDFQADILSKLVKYDIKSAPSPEQAIHLLKSLEPRKLKNTYKSLAILSEFCRPTEACHYWRLAAYRGSKKSQCSLIASLLESTHQSLEGIYWLHRYARFSQNGLEKLVSTYLEGVKMFNDAQDSTEWFIKPQPERAKVVLLVAARNGNSLVTYQLALQNKNFEQAWNVLQTLNPAKKRTNFELARAYHYGLPDVLQPDYDTAAQYYYQAIVLGFSNESILPHLISLAQHGSQKAQLYLEQMN